MSITKPQKCGCLLIFFLLISAVVFTQQTAPYTIPRQIYIGDPAVLIVPLPASTENHPDITTAAASHDSIDFHKITLERRINGSRLIIEFTAYTTGECELPIIEIGGYYFPNLIITVNSIIDRKTAVTLSAPASSLAMPGTAIMLYGTMTVIIVFLLTAIWFFVKGKKVIGVWKEKWKRWRLFTNMRQTERRLYKACLKGTDKRLILDKLSGEFRNFLSVLLNQNCRAMTARELGGIKEIGNGADNNLIDLNKYFSLLDDYRFSGVNAGIDTDNVLQLLKDLRNFIDAIEISIKEAAIIEKNRAACKATIQEDA